MDNSTRPCPRFDFHIHTKYLGCGNATMEVPAIAAECGRLGVTALAITDHLNSREFLPKHAPILEDIRRLEGGPDVWFGAEVNYDGPDGSFAYDRDIAREHGFQFAIGGIHGTYLQEYDIARIVDIQHRHHLKTCRDPLVEVLVHPYWFGKGEFERKNWPWFTSMKVVPERYVRELGRAARESGTAIEINACANLRNPVFPESYVKEYLEFLAILAEEGPLFSVSSDAHDISHLARIAGSWETAEALGLPPERIWKPACAPMRKGSAER